MPMVLHTQWKQDDCLPIIRTFRQASRVSLSPRSGRNERSEWRTVRRTVDWRGAQPLNAFDSNVRAVATRPSPQLSGLPGVRRDETSPIQRVEFPPRQGPVSHRESSLALWKATTMTKRRQSDRQAVTQVKRWSLVTTEQAEADRVLGREGTSKRGQMTTALETLPGSESTACLETEGCRDSGSPWRSHASE